MKFLKMHGLGNDFVVLDGRKAALILSFEQIRQICDRHRGVGCDQLVLLGPSQKADIKALFYNADGSESGACGNGTRCVADIVMTEKGVDKCTVETRAGILPAIRAGEGLITVDMGAPKLEWQDIPLSEPTDTQHLGIVGEGDVRNPVAVNMGNPHCVFFVEDLEQVDIARLGPYFENYPLFPERTNVEFVHVMSRGQMRLRTWERGAGLTLACGSAACAAAVAGVLRDLTDRKVEIFVDGGALNLEYRAKDDHVLMTGPYTYVFEGELRDV